MSFTLQNDQIVVRVQPKGAELTSLQSKNNGLEYLWQANPAVWGRHAPILFPIVGKLRNDQYEWQGRPYPLSQHGFARDQVFEVMTQTPQSLTLTLNSSAETLKVYPFPFELRLTYSLSDSRLDIAYEVINRGEAEMLFSIGAHPGFACPLLPYEAFEDYFLEFDQPETLERHLLENGLFSGKTEPLLHQQKRLPLHRSLFEKDAIVVEGYRSDSVTLKSYRTSHAVKIKFAGFPWLGIWTKAAPGQSPAFICVEPWYGLADSVDASGQLADKKGILTLPKGESFHCLHSVEVS